MSECIRICIYIRTYIRIYIRKGILDIDIVCIVMSVNLVL